MVKTIRISDETHEMIDNFGRRGETFEDILKRMLRTATTKQRQRRRQQEEEAI